jgi:ligand-binding SRPBCC domain-containing protein
VIVNIREIRESIVLPMTLQTAWDFFADPANLNEVTPPEMRFQTQGGDPGPVHEGQLLWHRVKLGPLVYRTWVTRIEVVREREYFIDDQPFGPFKLWHHRHSFRPIGDNEVEVTDTVRYALPFWPLGELAHGLLVAPKLKAMFDYRRSALERMFGTAAKN